MVATRAVHFAATGITVGTIIFRIAIANAVLCSDKAATTSLRTAMLRVASLGLAATVISGMIWRLLQAASMSGMPFNEAMTTDVLSTVFTETQFGQVTAIRLGLTIVLAACLAYDAIVIAQWLGLGAALGLAASLAWTGHAGSTLGATGYLHVAADALHVIASAAWIGGLVSLILFLAVVRRRQAVSLAHDAAKRFSTLGFVSVATLLLTGILNAAILVGSLRGLVVTPYGRLLMLKLGIFVIMLGLAAINQFRLRPRLVLPPDNDRNIKALHQLTRNSAIETVLGLAVPVIVGMLGTLHPAVHLLK
jgi:putative copper resistance protein D